MQIRTDEIIVTKRIRQDLGDLSALAKSLDKHGQLNPISITPDKHLIAGERRLEAAKLLGWETIEAHILPSLDAKAKLEIEIDENRNRKPFTPDELETALTQLDKYNHPSLFQRFLALLKRFFSHFTRSKRPSR